MIIFIMVLREKFNKGTKTLTFMMLKNFYHVLFCSIDTHSRFNAVFSKTFVILFETCFLKTLMLILETLSRHTRVSYVGFQCHRTLREK